MEPPDYDPDRVAKADMQAALCSCMWARFYDAAIKRLPPDTPPEQVVGITWENADAIWAEVKAKALSEIETMPLPPD